VTIGVHLGPLGRRAGRAVGNGPDAAISDDLPRVDPHRAVPSMTYGRVATGRRDSRGRHAASTLHTPGPWVAIHKKMKQKSTASSPSFSIGQKPLG
jgi:hypothetical protein